MSYGYIGFAGFADSITTGALCGGGAVVQHSLNVLGYGPLKEDGQIGTGTQAAMAKFCAAAGIPKKSWPDAQFCAALKAAVAVAEAPPPVVADAPPPTTTTSITTATPATPRTQPFTPAAAPPSADKTKLYIFASIGAVIVLGLLAYLMLGKKSSTMTKNGRRRRLRRNSLRSRKRRKASRHGPRTRRARRPKRPFASDAMVAWAKSVSKKKMRRNAMKRRHKLSHYKTKAAARAAGYHVNKRLRRNRRRKAMRSRIYDQVTYYKAFPGAGSRKAVRKRVKRGARRLNKIARTWAVKGHPKSIRNKVFLYERAKYTR